MAKRIPIDELLVLARDYPLFDVRTPAEYEQGHIPGAINLPLFTNDERAIIGTTYKQKGKNQAILQGLDMIGPRMRSLVETALIYIRDKKKPVLVHCWRGGMRSESVAWLFSLYGLDAMVLEGGYKSFRRYVLDIINRPRNFIVLGGHTGAGKTRVLYELRELGEPVLDLEGLASHKGSVFGHVHMEPPPTQEHFENRLAIEVKQFNDNRSVWVEDESRHLGRVVLPQGLWESMRRSPVYFINVKTEQRIVGLLEDYSGISDVEIKNLIKKVEKRLGGLDYKKAIEAVDGGDLAEVARLLLHYYDRAYEYGLHHREGKIAYKLDIMENDPANVAKMLVDQVVTTKDSDN